MMNNRNHMVECDDFCIDGHVIWMIHCRINALLKFDLNTNDTTYVLSFPNENMTQEYLFIRVCRVGKKLILIPGTANNIYVYDIERSAIIYQRNVRDMYKTQLAFVDACVIDDNIYCFPYEMGKPINVVEIDNLLQNQYIDIENNGIKKGYYNKCCYYNNCIYAVVADSNILTCVNIETGKTNFIAIKGVSGICGVTHDNAKLYLQSSKEAKMILYNPEQCKVEDEFIEGFALDKISGTMRALEEKKIWIDTHEEFAYIVDFKKKKIRAINKLLFGELLQQPLYNVGAIYKGMGGFYYYNKMRSCFFNVDENKEIAVRLKKADLVKIQKNIATNYIFVNENNCFDLFDFIDAL